MEKARPASLASSDTVRVTNPGGSSPFVLTCDHASNFLPAEFGTLGLAAEDLSRHIAWDPGALPVAHAHGARRSMRRWSKPAFRALSSTATGRSTRRTWCRRSARPQPYRAMPACRKSSARRGSPCHGSPFHDAIERIVDERLARGQETRLVSVHSFTPVYKGHDRPWHIGIIHDEDRRLASPLICGAQAARRRHRRRQRTLFACRPRLFHAGAACALARPCLRDDRNPQR